MRHVLTSVTRLWCPSIPLFLCCLHASPLHAQENPQAIPTIIRGTKEIIAEVIPSPRATSQGTVVRLIYSVMNYEESAVRVRLRTQLPDGWTLLDGSVGQQEYDIEPLDEIDGEILVTAARTAQAGDRHLVKLVAEVVGEEGVYEGQNFVSITRGGGLKPGAIGLTGTTTVGISRVSPSMTDSRMAGGVALSGTFGKTGPKQTTVSISGGRDMAENLTNYRYNFEEVKVAGTVRRGSLDATFGNIVFSGGTALTGPFVRGRGGNVRKTSGPFIFDLAITQPTTFTGDASGHLVRGRAGINKAFGSISFVASDYSRPSGYTTLLPPVTVLDPDEAERQEIERRLAAGATRNRVFGTGIEAEFRRQNLHRLTMRLGALHLENATGLSRTAPAGEIAYGYNGKAATFNARLRDTPPSMQGVQIGGDERWVDGTVRIYRNLQLVAQGFTSAYDVTGSQYSSLTDGGSLGTRFTRNGVRLELRGNHRESSYDTKSVRRTVAMYVGMPLGPFSLNGNAELGENETSRGRQPLSFYRADLRITRERGTASLGWSQISNGGLGVQQRIDALASIKMRDYELSGGAWATRGYTAGGHPGVWTTAAVPTSIGLTVVAGVEYTPLTYLGLPAWRGSLMLRRPLVVPLGFLKGFGTPAVTAASAQ
jgi:hypothetical protein